MLHAWFTVSSPSSWEREAGSDGPVVNALASGPHDGGFDPSRGR
jgi:hypothetical protein